MIITAYNSFLRFSYFYFRGLNVLNIYRLFILRQSLHYKGWFFFFFYSALSLRYYYHTRNIRIFKIISLRVPRINPSTCKQQIISFFLLHYVIELVELTDSSFCTINIPFVNNYYYLKNSYDKTTIVATTTFQHCLTRFTIILITCRQYVFDWLVFAFFL